MSGLLSLDDHDALDIGRVGAKAARLAEARQRGFRVLPGLVVTAAESGGAVRAGQVILDERGMGAARVTVGTFALDPRLIENLTHVSELGPKLVVRSSTGLDDDGSWSGAFSSFQDIEPGEVAMAVRSCWASLFAPDAIARFDQTGARPDSAGMAVLIQPQIVPSASGWMRNAGGFVEVAAIAGSPGPLLGGWERGSRYLVGPDGTVDDPASAGPVDPTTLRELAALARRAFGELVADRMEWAFVDGRIVILQVDRAAPGGPGAPASGPIPETLSAPPFRHLASVLIGRSGRLADRLIVPWAAAAADPVRPIEFAGPPTVVFAEAKRLAREMGDSVARSAGLTSAALLDLLDAADPVAIGRLAGVSVDPVTAGRVLGAIEMVGMSLAGRGLLESPDVVWWQTVDWIDAALTSDARSPAARWLGDRWDHLVYGVTVRNGEAWSGVAASDGLAAGRAVFIAQPGDIASFRSRDVLVLERPLPTFAPLLWKASALVCATGSAGAHLFEVARSLRVPAVVAADLPIPGTGLIAAVDGSSGEVWLWDRNGAQAAP